MHSLCFAGQDLDRKPPRACRGRAHPGWPQQKVLLTMLLGSPQPPGPGGWQPLSQARVAGFPAACCAPLTPARGLFTARTRIYCKLWLPGARGCLFLRVCSVPTAAGITARGVPEGARAHRLLQLQKAAESQHHRGVGMHRPKKTARVGLGLGTEPPPPPPLFEEPCHGLHRRARD